jgi:hypothetical protein
MGSSCAGATSAWIKAYRQLKLRSTLLSDH